MRQIFITKAGPPEVLQVRESPDPEAGAGQIRLRVKAAGINFADLSARTGMYQDAPKIPCVIGYEVSGVVDQVGAGVADFAVGDRALAMPYFGGYTDTLVVPASQAFKIPDAMSFEEAAAMPVVYLTAHHLLLFTGHLRPGSKIFIHSVAGGVGLAALEMARARNCIVFGTASKSKHEFVRERGCQHPIDSSSDYVAAVREILGASGGLDLVLDTVGGATWKQGYDLLGPGGRLVCFGVSTMQGGKTATWLRAIGMLFRMPWWHPIKLMNDNKTVSGCNMAKLFSSVELLRPQFASLLAMYERGEIKPFVDRTFKFDEAPAAHHYLHDRKARGKVLLIP